MVCMGSLVIVEIKVSSIKGSVNFFFSFKDTFTLTRTVNGTTNNVTLDGKGIAWWTDYNIKYRNPSVTPLKNAFNGSTFSLILS